MSNYVVVSPDPNQEKDPIDEFGVYVGADAGGVILAPIPEDAASRFTENEARIWAAKLGCEFRQERCKKTRNPTAF